MAKELDITPKYTYNADDDVYVIPVKHRVKPLVLKGYKVRVIRRAISNAITPSLVGADICAKYALREDDFDAIKKAFDLTRDAFPLTDEEVLDDTIEQGANKILEEKRFAVTQTAEKEAWKGTQKDAAAWREYQNNQVDPFRAALDAWVPPAIVKLSIPKYKTQEIGDEVVVIGLSDLHYGAKSDARYMFNRPDWSTAKTVECVKNYAGHLIQEFGNRRFMFKKAIILGLGDLLHSLNGKTGRGTELIFDVVREEQFEYALSSLFAFISSIAGVIPCVEVHSVYGNHNYESEMALFRALEQGFRTNANVQFRHYSTRPASFREGNTLFLLDHGADAIERAYVPTGSDSKLQGHVQSLLLQKPEMLIGTRERLFCMGDKHHWEHIEYNDFQFIMFSTLLGGDQHAAVHNLKNRARQSYLVIDDNGLKQVGHCYFD